MKELLSVIIVAAILVQWYVVPTPAVAATDIKNDDTLATNLYAYYKLDEASGTREDIHSTFDLTDNNTVASATGIINSGADFEAANSEYFSQTSANPSGAGDWSFSFWAKVESDPGTYALFSHYQNTGNQRSLVVNYTNNAGTKQLQAITSANGSTAVSGTINQTLTAGTWYYLSFLYDASAGTMEIYVNGSSIGTISSLRTSLHNSTDPFRIGAIGDGGGVTSYFDGIIDEFGIWSKLLTSAEVTELYNAGAGLPYEAAGGGAAPQRQAEFFMQ